LILNNLGQGFDIFNVYFIIVTYYIPLASTFFGQKDSNGCYFKSIYLHNTINESLESEYDPEDKLQGVQEFGYF
jgi:hypothetical protein